MTPLYELIYTSMLSDSANPSCVADIVRGARSFNATHDITGVLIFDGAHFCQYLEGIKDTVLNLMARIAVDPRHVDFTIRHEGHIDSPRRFSGWSLAYALDETGATLEKLLSTEGPDSSILLMNSIPHLDTDFSTHP